MINPIQNLWLKVFGDRRDQRIALRSAGFTDEAAAARWALALEPSDGSPLSRLGLTRRIRQARPDLTAATAVYIARQAKVRHI